jgi:hypothetical protein
VLFFTAKGLEVKLRLSLRGEGRCGLDDLQLRARPDTHPGPSREPVAAPRRLRQ